MNRSILLDMKRAAGRIGGLSRSAAKLRAARCNAVLGGRPRKGETLEAYRARKLIEKQTKGAD